MSIAWILIFRFFAGNPIRPPRCVPEIVERTITLLPSCSTSSILISRSGNAVVSSTRICLAPAGPGGGAARSVEQLRLINVELQMVPLRASVHIGGTDFIGMFMHGKAFADSPHLEPAAHTMLDE